MSTNKTLADVQPGGRVRLADQALSTTELRRNAHVLVLQELRARFTDAGSPSRTAALDAAIAALSAQPSPGGQGALDCIGRIEEAIEFRVPHDIYAAVHGELAELKAALSARQPVGEQRAALWIQFAENGNIRFWTKDQDRALAESFLHARPLTAFYASPQQSAQAVDLGQFRDVVADWRDRCCQAADKNTIVNMAKADRLLALIDKVVGK